MNESALRLFEKVLTATDLEIRIALANRSEIYERLGDLDNARACEIRMRLLESAPMR